MCIHLHVCICAVHECMQIALTRTKLPSCHCRSQCSSIDFSVLPYLPFNIKSQFIHLYCIFTLIINGSLWGRWQDLEVLRALKGQGFDCFAVVLYLNYRFSLVSVLMVYVVICFHEQVLHEPRWYIIWAIFSHASSVALCMAMSICRPVYHMVQTEIFQQLIFRSNF